ncbi:MAG: hypothetical protein N3H31_06405 [Candidatus Nezhaarchaeota archaeon]|nr:hypothetical protein [Candidatus Nezhaarchaeota archaeon]
MRVSPRPRLMWEYVLGGATVFGLIVGLFSIYNGRATRKLLMEEERMTRSLIAKMDERIAKVDERMAKMDERIAKVDERLEAILRSIEALIERGSKEHAAILEAVGQAGRSK